MARPIRTVVIIDADGKPATVEISKLQKATKDLDSDVGKASKGFGAMGDAAGNIPGPVGEIANALSGPAGVVGGIGAAVGGLVAMANQFADTAIEAQTLAEATNSTVEEASQLLAGVKQFGLEYNDVTDIALQVTGALEGNVVLMEKLGLTAEQAENPMENIKAAIDAWDLLTATERAQAFGEEGVRQIARIIASGESLDEILAGVSDAQVLSPEDVERANELKETTADLKELWDDVVINVGGFVAKDMNDLKNVVGAITGQMNIFGDSIEESIEKSQRLAAEQRAAAETSRWEALAAQYEATGDAGVDAFERIDNSLAILKGEIDDRQAFRALEDQFGKLKDASQEWTDAAVAGTDDVKDKQRAYNVELDKTNEKIIDYAVNILGLPDEAVTEIVAQLDAGNVAFVEAQLAGLARRRIVNLEARTVGGFDPGVGGPGGTSLGSGNVNNLNISMGRLASSREVDAAINRWRRING